MKNKNEIAELLCEAAERIELAETVKAVRGVNVKISIPLGKMTVDTDIDELGFSVRASNCLHRAGHATVGDVVDAINNEELARYRNLGRKTVSEIKTRLLVLGYGKLSDIEKKSFWCDFIERNRMTHKIDESMVAELTDASCLAKNEK